MAAWEAASCRCCPEQPSCLPSLHQAQCQRSPRHPKSCCVWTLSPAGRLAPRLGQAYLSCYSAAHLHPCDMRVASWPFVSWVVRRRPAQRPAGRPLGASSGKGSGRLPPRPGLAPFGQNLRGQDHAGPRRTYPPSWQNHRSRCGLPVGQQDGPAGVFPDRLERLSLRSAREKLCSENSRTFGREPHRSLGLPVEPGARGRSPLG